MSIGRMSPKHVSKWLNKDGSVPLSGDWDVGANRKIECDRLAARSGNYYTLPASDGTADDVLVTNGSGLLSWKTIGEAGGDASYMPLTGGTFTGAVVANDHGTPSTDEIVGVCYGTGDPPTATTTTIGTLFIKYVA